jgi:hypothetical protein
MKITATKRANRIEVETRKADYDAKSQAYEDAYKAKSRVAREAREAITEPIKEEIMQNLKVFNTLRFEVSAQFDIAYPASYDSERTYVKVRIRCNESDRSDDDALRWEYEVGLDYNGNVVSDTGSWSGLSATTPAQLKSLRQTLFALEYLNDVDWKDLLDKEAPNTWNEGEPLPEKPAYENWDSQFATADMEDIVGDKGVAILVYNWENSPYWGRNVYLRILRETPSQYVVNVIPSHYKDDYEKLKADGRESSVVDMFKYTQRIRKTTTGPVYDASGEPQYWDLPSELASVGG